MAETRRDRFGSVRRLYKSFVLLEAGASIIFFGSLMHNPQLELCATNALQELQDRGYKTPSGSDPVRVYPGCTPDELNASQAGGLQHINATSAFWPSASWPWSLDDMSASKSPFLTFVPGELLGADGARQAVGADKVYQGVFNFLAFFVFNDNAFAVAPPYSPPRHRQGAPCHAPRALRYRWLPTALRAR